MTNCLRFANVICAKRRTLKRPLNLTKVKGNRLWIVGVQGALPPCHSLFFERSENKKATVLYFMKRILDWGDIMSKLVLHMEKVKSAAVMNSIGDENDRSTEQEIEKQRRRNSSIDGTRTAENFDALEGIKHSLKMYDRVQQRIASGYTSKRKIRKDAVKMIDGVIGSDSFFFEGMNLSDRERFARDCASFLVEQVGRENLVGCRWHNDENPPHLHFQFVPLRDGKLNVKACGFTQGGLQSWHTKLWKYLHDRGWEIERGEERQAWQEPVQHLHPNAYKRRHFGNAIQMEHVLQSIDNRVEYSTTGLLNRHEIVKMSVDDYDELKGLATAAVSLRSQVDDLNGELQPYRDEYGKMKRRFREELSIVDDDIEYMRQLNADLADENLQVQAERKLQELKKREQDIKHREQQTEALLRSAEASYKDAQAVADEFLQRAADASGERAKIDRLLESVKKENKEKWAEMVEAGRRLLADDMHKRYREQRQSTKREQLRSRERP